MDANLILMLLKLVKLYGKLKTLQIVDVFIQLKQESTQTDQSWLREEILQFLDTI